MERRLGFIPSPAAPLPELRQHPQRRKALANRRAALGRTPEKALRNMTAQDLSVSEIAAKIGRGNKTVRSWFKEYNITPAHKPLERRKRLKITDEEIEERRRKIQTAQEAGLFNYLTLHQQQVLSALYPEQGPVPSQATVARNLGVARAAVDSTEKGGFARLDKLLPEPLPSYRLDLPSGVNEISVLKLSNKTYNALCRAGIFTIRQAYETPDSNLLKIRAFGKTCLRDLREKLEKFRQELSRQVSVNRY